MPSNLEAVAKRAGVSLSTASRILSNGSKYSFKPETRERVINACRELGYQPNMAARALASGRSQIIAFAVPRIYDTPFTALGYLQVLASLEEAFSKRGYHVLICSPRFIDGEPDPSFQRLVRSGYLDGIIVDGHFAIEPLMQIIRKHDLPCVAVGYTAHDYTLRADNFSGCKMLMQHLCALGHRRIGIIGLQDDLFLAGRERLAGIKAGAEENGLDFETMPYIDGQFSQVGCRQAIQELITNHPELTAVVALNDRLALNAMRAIMEMGKQIPQDISVVGFDDLPQSADVIPGLTTINQNLHLWGEIAAEMLLEIIDGGAPESVVLDTELVVRDSTAAPRK